MNNLPVQLVHLLRRLVDAISLTNHYFVNTSRSISIWSWLMYAYSSNSLSLDLGWRLYSTRPTDSMPCCEQNGLGSDARFSLSPPDATQSTRRRDDRRSSSSHTPPRDTIHRLMNNPALFNPARAPRYPLVLCHGLYGFDVKGPAAFPSLRMHYWSSVLSILKDKLGAEVIVTGVPGTGSIASRGESLDRILQQRARGRGINLVAHSMGGLDCRHLITHVRPTEYVPLSLTSVSTPHRGSPFMDWCAQYLGLGRRQDQPMYENRPEQPTRTDVDLTSSTNASEKQEAAFRLSLPAFPSSCTTILLSLFDSPAYANLTTSYLNNLFNPSTPDDPRVKYYSVASRVDDMNIWHPLWFPKMVLDDAERQARERAKAAAEKACPPGEREDEWGNDGLVTIQSARWGEFLGVLDGCDHWEIRGARGVEMNVELPSGIGGLTNRVAGEGWDWSKFVGTWRKHDKGTPEGLELAQAAGAVSPDIAETERMARDGNDPVVQASTDRLSAVFDWIVEHVPTSGNASPTKEALPPKKTPKFDLERFYVALTRKLYDEGL